MDLFHILLVEDNPLDTRLIQSFLAKMEEGRLECVATLAEALDRVASERVDLVLLDLCLPDSEDLDTFLLLHSKAPDLPIVVLTGTDDGSLALRAMQSGAQDYLVKGAINSRLLERSIRYAIERKHAEGNIRAYQEQLRKLASELANVAQRERKRIATDLHDNIGQLLALAKLQLGAVDCLPEGKPARQEVSHLLDEAIRYTRNLIGELSPPILHELGLEAALEWLAEQLSARHSLSIAVRNEWGPCLLDEELQGMLFWSVRELLLNVIKHAQAKSVIIRIHPAADGPRITVKDDGIGFDPQARSFGNQGGFGLFSLRERLEQLGGGLIIVSKPQQGAAISLCLPPKCAGLSITRTNAIITS